MITDDKIINIENILEDQKNSIQALKLNVKWLYKYGGSGTGKGSGGGDSSTTKLPLLVYTSEEGNVEALLGETRPKTLILSKGNTTFNFFLKFLNKEHTYKVTYSIDKGKSYTSIAISEFNDFVLPLAIEDNTSLIVRLVDITDNTNGYAVLLLNIVVYPIKTNIYLLGETVNGSTRISGEIFMQNYSKIYLVLEYTPYLEGSFKASCELLSSPDRDYEDTSVEIEHTILIKKELHNTDFLQQPTNVGPYLITYNTEFTTKEGNTKTETLTINYTLIPNTIYPILKTTEGSIYKNILDNPYKFKAGAITFISYIYEGADDGNTYLDVKIDIYRETGDDKSLIYSFPINEIAKERVNFLSDGKGVFYLDNDNIKNAKGDWFKIVISIKKLSTDEALTYDYYFYGEKNDKVLRWFPKSSKEYVEQYFNKSNVNSDCFEGEKTIINNYINIEPKKFTFKWYEDGSDITYNQPEVYIAASFNLEEGNDGVLLASIFNKNEDEVIWIYQNKIVLAGGGEIEIYQPMDGEYHLLLIYLRIVAQGENNTVYREWIAYIDGIIEGALPTFTTTGVQLLNIVFNPNKKGSFKINHFNCVIFNCLSPRWYINNSDSLYSAMEDINITEYYYKYKCTTNSIYKETDYFDSLDALKEISYTYNENNNQEQFTKLSEGNVTALKLYGGLPVLVFETDKESTEGLLGQMVLTNIGEEQSLGAIRLEGLQYYKKGNKTAEPCNSTLNTSDYYYEIEILGSSTKNVKHKNWELMIGSLKGDEIIPIFSLDYGEENGFFPEQSFTFKNDIVDSSHSNNTSIGDFVNSVCTPFNPGYKNCLTGKPIILIIKNTKASAEEIYPYYFLGIYNYNLGRNSKYNLNYANTPQIDTTKTGYTVQTTDNVLTKATYASAEILNNSCFWDFSQYHESILFEDKYLMDADNSKPTNEILESHVDSYYMWGDLKYVQNFDINAAILNCVKSVSRAGGFLFDWLGKEFTDNAYMTKLSNNSTEKPKAWKEINKVPNSKNLYIRKLKYENLSPVYTFTKNNIPEDTYTELDLLDCILGTIGEEGQITSLPFINYNSVMEYYVIMLAFGLVDSPEKNLNIKTWNGTTFYAAFYDMDTGLELDNGGGLTITPFAFSDYWDSNPTTGIVTRRLDFWPESGGGIGFDVPSSFLFAIGKYASYYMLTKLNNETAWISPRDFWAKLRKVDGKLQNASYFIDNFFNNKFSDTHPIVWNLNYRCKYLLLQGTSSFDVTLYSKFHGRRVHRAKAWLNNRIHMLDAYFNINNLDYTAEEKNTVSLKVNKPTVEIGDLQLNKDVILLLNIFNSGTDSIKTSNNISCTVRALDYSPFIMQTSSTTSEVRLFNKGLDYNIQASVQGNQAVYPYGGSKWTYIDKVDSFIQNNLPFYIKNDYMESFKCTLPNVNSSPSSWQLHLPKVLTVEITGNNLKGPLTIYPGTSLTKLDLSNTEIGFKTTISQDTANYCPYLKYINLTNYKGEIELIGCPSLENLILNGAYINKLVVNPYLGNCSYTNTNIKELEIHAINSNSTKFNINSDNSLKTLTLEGFEEITIDKCPRLETIRLNSFNLKKLSITNCYNNVKILNLKGETFNFESLESLILDSTKIDSTMGSITGGLGLKNISARILDGDSYTINIILDLTKCSLLEKANFTRTYIEKIKVNTITIDNTNIDFRQGLFTSLEGIYNISSNGGAFYNCVNLLTIQNVNIQEGVTSVAGLFLYCLLLQTVESLTLPSTITDVSYIFDYCIRFSDSDDIFSNALSEHAHSITNIKSMLLSTAIMDISKYLYTFENITDANNIGGAFNVPVINTIISKDLLNKFPGIKITFDYFRLFRWESGSDYWKNQHTRTIKFNIDALEGLKFSTLNFANIIIGGITDMSFFYKVPDKCTSLSNVTFPHNTTISFNGISEGKFTTINNFLNDTHYICYTDSVEGFFKKCLKISDSLNALQIKDGLDLYNFINWNDYIENNKLLFFKNFNINKKITSSDFKTLIGKIFNSLTVEKVNSVFKNCTITHNENVLVLDINIPSNSRIIDITSLFLNCHTFYINTGNNTKQKVYLNFKSEDNIGFSNLSNLSYCLDTWRNCYLNKLSEQWFYNGTKLLTLENAFSYAQFYLNYSDDISDKEAYKVTSSIYKGNQSGISESNREAIILNSTIDNGFYHNDREGHYIIPSKFFYYEKEGQYISKLLSGIILNNIFTYSTLYGLLPELLFTSNLRPSEYCNSMFLGCTIIPYHVKDVYHIFDINKVKEVLSRETSSKEDIENLIYKVSIYCIVPNGTLDTLTEEHTPYLSGSIGNTLNGCIIVPTIHQSKDISLNYNTFKEAIQNKVLEENTDYIVLEESDSFKEENDIENSLSIRQLDFIYLYNLYSIDLNATSFSKCLPGTLGLPENHINNREDLEYELNYMGLNILSSPITWAFNYNPSLIGGLNHSNEGFKIHYGIQYNGGNNVLVVDSFNTDGLTHSFPKTATAHNKLTTSNIINWVSGLLLYGPIFNKDLLMGRDLADDDLCEGLQSLVKTANYPNGSITNNNTQSGYRFLDTGNHVLCVYDLSRNIYFPESISNVTPISNIIKGGIFTTTDNNVITYTYNRYYNKRGNGNYSGLLILYPSK